MCENQATAGAVIMMMMVVAVMKMQSGFKLISTAPVVAMKKCFTTQEFSKQPSVEYLLLVDIYFCF